MASRQSTAKNDFLPDRTGEEMLAKRNFFLIPTVFGTEFSLVNAREKSRGIGLF